MLHGCVLKKKVYNCSSISKPLHKCSVCWPDLYTANILVYLFSETCCNSTSSVPTTHIHAIFYGLAPRLLPILNQILHKRWHCYGKTTCT